MLKSERGQSVIVLALLIIGVFAAIVSTPERNVHKSPV